MLRLSQLALNWFSFMKKKKLRVIYSELKMTGLNSHPTINDRHCHSEVLETWP